MFRNWDSMTTEQKQRSITRAWTLCGIGLCIMAVFVGVAIGLSSR